MNHARNVPLNEQDVEFFARVENLRAAAREILPGTESAKQLEDLCRRLTSSYHDVRTFSRTTRSPIVVVATRALDTRHWIVRALRRALPEQLVDAGDLPDEDLEGFGPSRPDWFSRQNRFELIDSNRWIGASPWSCLAIDPSKVERIDADLMLYVVKYEELQTDAAIRTIRPFSGIPIVPVVLNATGESRGDINAFVERLKVVLGNGELLPCLDFPDFNDKRTKLTSSDAERKLWDQCQSSVNITESKRRHVQDERCHAIRRRFDSDAQNILKKSEFGQVNHSIRELMAAKKKVLQTQTMKWVSGNDDLRIPIRIRLRLIACEITPPVCFPFRSILGALALTTGVWDRVAMAMLGSPVALALAAYQSGGQLWKSRSTLHELSADAGNQFSRKVVGDLTDVLSETRRAIKNRLPFSQVLLDIDKDEIHVRGADILLQDVRAVLDQACRSQVSRRVVQGAALICTFVFLVLVSGPIIALYGDYVRPLFDVWLGRSNGIESFPLPELPRIFTGFLLGIVPGIVAGMVLLAWLTRKYVVERLTRDIRCSINEHIDTMIKEESLRLEGLDDSFVHIRFLNAFQDSGRTPL